MKRFLLIISILLSCQAFAGTPGRTTSKAGIASTIAECKSIDGVELVELGRAATAALKGAIRLATINDPDGREVLKLMKGIRSITVLDYENCSQSDREKISLKIERALSGNDVLIEASDGGEKMRIYGLVDDKTDKVRDFVMYSPSDYALICIFGSISMDAIAKIASDD
ncbi:MAG: DUF4252 domain-containing protein [Bacteroidales bacterium]|nr:DUF4252 domain-containing protein [Bacteroidales bacterium]